jgi:hypothetical protein
MARALSVRNSKAHGIFEDEKQVPGSSRTLPLGILGHPWPVNIVLDLGEYHGAYLARGPQAF